MNTKQLLLCVLMGGPASGYDIEKIVEQRASRVVDASLSNVYPALNELAREGLVQFRKVEQEGRPNKKVYELTPDGRAACLDAVTKMECQTRIRSEFMFVLSFVPGLPRERLSELIDQRIADIEAQLAGFASEQKAHAPVHGTDGPGRQFVVDLGRVLLKTEHEYLQANRELLIDNAGDGSGSDYLAAD